MKAMKIAVTYNRRTDESEDQGEMYRPEEVERLTGAIESLDHSVTAVEASGPSTELVDKLLDVQPDLIFNVAEGKPHQGVAREAHYPAIFDMMGIPYTGGRASILYVGLDKRLTEKTVNMLYEAVVECTHEAVLNAMFHSLGQRGRDGHVAPAIPAELIADRCRSRDGGYE